MRRFRDQQGCVRQRRLNDSLARATSLDRRLRIEALEHRCLLSTSPTLVKDIDETPAPYGSEPRALTLAGSYVYFSANDGVHGSELWKSDGTAAGTVLVKDVLPGQAGAHLGYFTGVGDKVYFWVGGSTAHAGLWTSDGSSAGTRHVKAITPGVLPGPFPSLPRARLGQQLIVAADDGVHGPELWTSDGSAEGTTLLKDIRIGSAGSAIESMFAVRDAVYFLADDGVYGRELWRTDGTEAGTRLVKDLTAGPNGSYLGGFTEFGGRLFFAFDDGQHGSELWSTDGSEENTTLFADIAPGNASSAPDWLTVVGDELYFTVANGNYRDLWKSDGMAEGTVFVDGVSAGGPPRPARLTEFNSKLYFIGGYTNAPLDLCVSDGTTAGTKLINNPYPSVYARPTALYVVGSELLIRT
jgi:ELWxxDGT repeat protein